MADEAALKELTSNLGLLCNFSSESNVATEQISGRGFWEIGYVNSEVGTDEVEEVGEEGGEF